MNYSFDLIEFFIHSLLYNLPCFQISKLDIVNNGKLVSWSDNKVLASEPIFVPNPTIENPQEDDGVVLAALLYEDDQYKTSLLVLDAKDMKELARVDFKAHGPVTATFHGLYAGDNDKVHFY